MRTRLLLPVSLFAASCGSIEAQPSRLSTVGATPARGAAVASESTTAPAAVECLGRSSAGSVIAVAAGEVYEIAGGIVQPRQLYAVGDEPTSTGAVNAIAPRLAGGAWISASRGLFVLEGLYVTRSPIDTGMGPLHQTAQPESGALAGLWLASDGGLFRSQTSGFEKYVLPGIEGAARGIAVDSHSDAAFAIVADQLVLLTLREGQLVFEEAPLAVGTVYEVAAGDGALYAATEKGLLRWRADAKVPWTHFSGAGGTRAVSVDAQSSTAWARTGAELLKLDGDTLTAHQAPAVAAGGPLALSLDGNGDLWMNDAAQAVRFKVGCASIGVTFANDVRPWLGERCTKCHADFANPDVFTPKADMALGRVKAGDMPRCTGGVPCPENQHLPAAEYAVLVDWIRCGKTR